MKRRRQQQTAGPHIQKLLFEKWQQNDSFVIKIDFLLMDQWINGLNRSGFNIAAGRNEHDRTLHFPEAHLFCIHLKKKSIFISTFQTGCSSSSKLISFLDWVSNWTRMCSKQNEEKINIARQVPLVLAANAATADSIYGDRRSQPLVEAFCCFRCVNHCQKGLSFPVF